MTSFVVGCDLNATGIAMVWGHSPDDLQGRNWHFTDTSGPDSLVYALKALNRWHRKHTDMEAGGKWCFIEHPVVAGAMNIRTTIVQAYMNGIVQASFYGEGYTTAVIPPAEWKKAIGIGGNANKARIKAWAEEAVPRVAVAGDQDIDDAAGLWTFGTITAAFNESGG